MTLAEEIALTINSPEDMFEINYQTPALSEVWKAKAKNSPKETAEQVLKWRKLDFLEIFKIILASSLENAEKIVENIDNNNGYRDFALEKIIKILVEQDLEKAWLAVFKIENKWIKENSINLVLNAMYTKAQDKFNEIASSSDTSDDSLLGIAIIQARQDIQTAKQTIQRIKNVKLQNEALVKILVALAVYSPEEAINEAQLLPHTSSNSLISRILFAIAENKPHNVLSMIVLKKITCRDEDLSKIVDILSEKKSEDNLLKAKMIASCILNVELQNQAYKKIIEESVGFRIAIGPAQEILKKGLSYDHVDALTLLCDKKL